MQETTFPTRWAALLGQRRWGWASLTLAGSRVSDWWRQDDDHTGDTWLEGVKVFKGGEKQLLQDTDMEAETKPADKETSLKALLEVKAPCLASRGDNRASFRALICTVDSPRRRDGGQSPAARGWC